MNKIFIIFCIILIFKTSLDMEKIKDSFNIEYRNKDTLTQNEALKFILELNHKMKYEDFQNLLKNIKNLNELSPEQYEYFEDYRVYKAILSNYFKKEKYYEKKKFSDYYFLGLLEKDYEIYYQEQLIKSGIEKKKVNGEL